MFNLHTNQAVNILRGSKLRQRRTQIAVQVPPKGGTTLMRQKPNLLIFDLVFKLNLGQSQQQSQFRDMKILVCSNSYNVFGFQMSIKDYCQLKARLKSHNILGELYLILKNKRQTPQKTLHLISSLSSYPRTNQCYGTGVKVHNVWVTKCLYTNLRTP